MGWKLVLYLFVGLATSASISSNSAWRPGYEYVYKVHGVSLSNYDDDYYKGIVLKADLIVQPQSAEVIIGKISNPQYARYEGEDKPTKQDVDAQELQYKPLDLGDKPFRIRVKQGVIRNIEVASELEHWKVNMIKAIVSQTQLDIQGVNLMKDRINQLPENDSYSGVYKTMEEGVTGKFATLYELNEVPSTQIQYKPWRVPFPQLQGEGSIMEVVKTIDYSKSKERVMYSYGLATDEDTDLHDIWMGNFLSRVTTTQAFISGRPNEYTIQCAIAYDSIAAAPLHNNRKKFSVESGFNITLTKYESTTSQLQLPSSLKSQGSLTYSYNENAGKDKNNCDESSSSSSSSSSSQDSGCSPKNQQGQQHHKNKSASSSSSSSSSFSSEFSSMSDESDWKDDQPKLTEAPQSGLLPLTMGYMGQLVHSHEKVNPVAVVQKLANEIAQGIVNPNAQSAPQTLSRFVMLTTFIRTMNEQQLQQATSAHYSNEQGTLKSYAWQALRDALAEGGTGPCLLVLSSLMSQSKISPGMAAFVFDQITRSARQPTEEYMRALFTFSKNPKIEADPELSTIIPIAFANLVRKVYVNKVASHDQYPVHSYGRFYTERGMEFVVNEYIPYLRGQLERSISATDSPKVQIYISALGAVGHRYILKVFKPYFNGEKYATPYQRLQMVYALDALAKYNRKSTQSVLYKIYQNFAEDEDVRVACVYMLMKTAPPAYMLKKMAVYINIDQSQQVSSAVESIIRALSKMDGPEYNEMRENAIAALYLLNDKSYSTQYSKKYMENNYFHESNSEFMQALQTIVGEDSSVPKVMKYSLNTNINGVKTNALRIEFMVNSIGQLTDALFRQSATYQHQQRQQHQHASKANENPWTPENIAHKLKMHREKPNYLEGSFSFEFAGLQKRYLFNDESIAMLSKVIGHIEQEFQGKKTLEFTKFINNNDIAVSTPTIVGIPCIYTFDEPTLIHLEGHITASAEPKVSTGDALRLPKSVQAAGEIKAYISKKRQGQLGFVVPFTGEHFLVGYEKNMQLQIPLSVQYSADIANGKYTIQMSVAEPQQNFNLFSFNSLPYIAARNVVNFTPVVEDSNTQIIKENTPKTSIDQVFGETTGVAIRVQLHSEEKLNLPWFFEKVQAFEGNRIPLLMAAWYDESVGYSHLNVQYDGKRSSNSRIKVHIGYQAGQENGRNHGDVDIGQLYKTPSDRQARQKQFSQMASSNISNSEVQVLDVEVQFSGKQEITYSATAAVATSYVDPKSNFLFYATRQPSNLRAVEPYKVALLVKTHVPKTNGLDPTFALKNGVIRSIQGQLGFGKDEHSSAKINMHATLDKTNEYSQYLAKHPLSYHCAQEMKEGNYLLEACTSLLTKANLVDHVAMKLQYENLGMQALNSTKWLTQVFRHHFFENYEENSVNSTGSNANQINIDFNFHDDFEQIDLQIQTEHKNMLFEDVDTDELVGLVNNIHPVLSAQDRILRPLFEQEWPFPYCSIDKTYANTFDNYTYPINPNALNDWTVALLYSPSYANYPYYQNQQNNQGQGLPPRYRDDYQKHPQQSPRQRGHHYPQNDQQGEYQPGHQQPSYQQHGSQQHGSQQHGSQHQNPQHQRSRYQNGQGQQNPSQQHQKYGHSQGTSEHPSHFKQPQVEHNQHQQPEQYAVLVRNKPNSNGQKEVKMMIRSPETGHQLMEIDMVPSGRQDSRAEVYVNQKKQQIQQDRSLDYGGDIQIYLAPNGEVSFAVLDVFQVLYDGHRFRLSILDEEKFQNDVRGLCGTFNGNPWTDFACPENCLVKSSEDFVGAYQPNRQSRPEGKGHECYFREVIYGDVVSEQDVGNKPHKKNEEQRGSCTKHQTRYIRMDQTGEVCFTTRPLPVCKPQCKPKQRISKEVEVYCAPHDQSQLWMKQIDKGANPNFSIKTPTRRVPIQVDQSCAMH